MARLIDLSHEIEHGMVTYPGLEPPVISEWMSRDASRAKYAPGTTFHIGKIEMIANTGTYMDAPFHRHEGGADIAAYPLDGGGRGRHRVPSHGSQGQGARRALLSLE